MKNYVQKGDYLQWTIPTTSPATQVASGEIVTIGDVVGVAASAGESGDTIAVALEGVFTLPKDNTNITLGAKVYVDTNAQATIDPDDGASPPVAHKELGQAFSAAGTSATTVQVKIG
jgi:predicted RecA/RadA family phage recombinase